MHRERLPADESRPSGSNIEADVIRVLLVGTQQVTLAGLQMLIDREPGLKVVGMAADADQFPVVAVRDRPDITLVDLDQGGDLVLVPKILRMTGTAARVIVLTSVSNPTVRAAVFRHGAMGLVVKQQLPALLIKAIRKVHAGEVWLERSHTARLLADIVRPRRGGAGASSAPPPPALSARDREIIVLTSQGLRNKEIAKRLFLSEGTVRNQLTSIYKKLGLSGRAQLVTYAFQQGFVKLPRPAGTRVAASTGRMLRLAAKGGLSDGPPSRSRTTG